MRQLVDEERALRARPDKAHVATQHVEKLGQFVDAQATNDVADACDAVVVGAGPARLAVLFSIGVHAAELGNAEGAAVLAHPLLAVEHRARAFEFDEQCCDQHQRRRQHAQDGGTEDVENAFNACAQGPLVEAVAKDQPARAEEIDANLPQRLLEVRIEVVDLGPGSLAVEQLTQGHAARAAFSQRHHDLVHGQPVRHARQGVVKLQNLIRWHCRFTFIGAGQVTHDFGVGVCGAQRVAHHKGGRAGTENHDAGSAGWRA